MYYKRELPKQMREFMKERRNLFVAVMLALFLTCTGFGVLLLSDNGNEKKAAVTHIPSGQGSSSNPFLIGNFSEMNVIVRQIAGLTRTDGYHFKLTSDITFNGTWAPIPLLASGNTFDGGGKTLSDMNIGGGASAGGLFANLNGTVKDLNFLNVSAEEGTLKGAVAGIVAGENVDALIEKVGVFSDDPSNLTGGLVGAVGLVSNSKAKSAVNMGDVKLTVVESFNEAAVSADANNQAAGGIIGLISGATVNISKTHNKGNVIAPDDISVGGIIGEISDSTVTIDSCFNTGSIQSGQGNIGGIAGAITGSGNNVEIKSCASSGSISAGIAPNCTGVVITDCYYSSGTGEGTLVCQSQIDAVINSIIGGAPVRIYSVTRPESGDGFTVVNASHAVSESIIYGMEYYFTVQLAEGYRLEAPSFYGTIGDIPALVSCDLETGYYVYSFTVTKATAISISATKDPIKLATYSITLTNNNTANDGFTIIGNTPAKVAHGDSRTIIVSPLVTHSQRTPDVTVTMGGVPQQGEVIGGVFSITLIITGDVTVSVVPLAVNQHSVTVIPQEGYVISGDITDSGIYEERDYTVTVCHSDPDGKFVMPTEEFKVFVTKAGNKTEALSAEGQFTLQLNADAVISFAPLSVKQYLVNAPVGSDFVYIPVSGFAYDCGEIYVEHGGKYTFGIELDSAHSQMMQSCAARPCVDAVCPRLHVYYTMGSDPTNIPVERDGRLCTITGEITDTVTIYVGNLVKNNYTITVIKLPLNDAELDQLLSVTCMNWTGNSASVFEHGALLRMLISYAGSGNYSSISVVINGEAVKLDSIAGSPFLLVKDWFPATDDLEIVVTMNK